MKTRVCLKYSGHNWGFLLVDNFNYFKFFLHKYPYKLPYIIPNYSGINLVGTNKVLRTKPCYIFLNFASFSNYMYLK